MLHAPWYVFLPRHLIQLAFTIIPQFVHGVYKRYEPDTSSPFIQFILLVAVPSIPAACFLPHYTSTAIAILVAYASFYVSLLTSIVLYRISPWHPLAKYPGPLIAKISKIWASYVMATGEYHLVTKKLHEKYGRYVRIGRSLLIAQIPLFRS